MKSVAYDSYLEGKIELKCDTAANLYGHRCTVHSVVYLINTPTNAHTFI